MPNGADAALRVMPNDVTATSATATGGRRLPVGVALTASGIPRRPAFAGSAFRALRHLRR